MTAAVVQEKHCRIYSRDSSPAVVGATQEAFRRWLEQRFGDRVQLCTPARRYELTQHSLFCKILVPM